MKFDKITIIVIISKSGQGKTYVEYEAGKNAGYGLVARWAGCKSERHGIRNCLVWVAI